MRAKIATTSAGTFLHDPQLALNRYVEPREKNGVSIVCFSRGRQSSSYVFIQANLSERENGRIHNMSFYHGLLKHSHIVLWSTPLENFRDVFTKSFLGPRCSVAGISSFIPFMLLRIVLHCLVKLTTQCSCFALIMIECSGIARIFEKMNIEVTTPNFVSAVSSGSWLS